MDVTSGVGNRAHLEAGGFAVEPELARAADSMLAEGLSPVFVAVDGPVAGVAGIGRRAPADARRTIDRLRRAASACASSSGDHPEVVARVGHTSASTRCCARRPDAEAKRDIVQRERGRWGDAARW